MPNRLASETSPYLRQHQNNPVDWYPWGEESLDRSVEENKPILLSIGYSACHWCHVMERESFEDPEIARIMNENFICIKVDREERPDLDHIYQNVAQALTHGGGWPLTVFLTPARRPFFGGTYFPPEDRYGRAGFKRVLLALAKAYQTDPIGVAQNAMKLTAFIEASESAASSAPGEVGELVLTLENAADVLVSHMDPEHGGFGSAPKFPNVSALFFLWRMGLLRENAAARDAVLLTLRKMASGGIYDQLGGGFSRYSVDATWSVPHFEKMLYDNGQLLQLYSEVLLTGWISHDDRELFGSVVDGTTKYLLREMESPDGGFYAAQDADSEGEEGKFFVWNLGELRDALPDERERRVFTLRFGVEEEGNFENGKTVLFTARTLAEIARELGIPEEEVRRLLDASIRKAFEARARRIPPATDTKILASWNGLLISGLSWASQALRAADHIAEADRALDAATRAFDLVREKMASGTNGNLAATFQAGKAKYNGYLDDYAFMTRAALDLARASQDEAVISRCERQALLWTKRVVRHFSDEKAGGYFFTSDDHEELLHRPKTLFDQAIPSGTAVTLENICVLAEMAADASPELEAEGDKQFRALLPWIEKSPMGCAELMNAAILRQVGPITVSGPGSREACPSPFVFRKSGDTKGALLVCHRRACDPPMENLAELRKAALSKVSFVSL